MKKKILIVIMVTMLFTTLPSFGHDHDVPVVKTLEHNEKPVDQLNVENN